MRRRFYGEMVLAGIAGVLGVVTIFWRDWIEALTGYDPDNHHGTFEWLIVGGLLAVAAVSAILARAEWRRGLAGQATR